MVDEYQDVNPCQEELIRLLHQRSQTLFVVGRRPVDLCMGGRRQQHFRFSTTLYRLQRAHPLPKFPQHGAHRPGFDAFAPPCWARAGFRKSGGLCESDAPGFQSDVVSTAPPRRDGLRIESGICWAPPMMTTASSVV